MKLNCTFVLDESGSMQVIKGDTIGGFNQYLGSLKGLDAEIKFTFLKFDSNSVTKVHVGAPIADVPELTDATYSPGAFTPLIDAAMEAILATEKVADAEAKVIVVIQTDGLENASTKYQRHDLAAKIKERTEAGWEFVFLGAGVDAYAEAGKLGIAAVQTMSYGLNKSGATFESLASNTAAYVVSRGATGMGFSDMQKDASDDFKNGRSVGTPPSSLPPDPVTPPKSVTVGNPSSLVDPIDLSH